MKPRINFEGIGDNPAIAYGVCFTEEAGYFITSENHLTKDNQDLEYDMFRQLYGHLTQLFEIKHNNYCNRHKGEVHTISLLNEFNGAFREKRK